MNIDYFPKQAYNMDNHFDLFLAWYKLKVDFDKSISMHFKIKYLCLMPIWLYAQILGKMYMQINFVDYVHVPWIVVRVHRDKSTTLTSANTLRLLFYFVWQIMVTLPSFYLVAWCADNALGAEFVELVDNWVRCCELLCSLCMGW